MVNGKPKILTRRGSLAAACGLAIALAVVAASAVTIVKPMPAALPAGTDVSAADSSGVNLLEPARTAAVSPKSAGAGAPDEGVERVVGEWTATGGGSGGGVSPKK